jgi:hypothetical protein
VVTAHRGGETNRKISSVLPDFDGRPMVQFRGSAVGSHTALCCELADELGLTAVAGEGYP